LTQTAGDVDYARHGENYAGHRRTDPRIAALVATALGDAHSVLNVGAGAGSYEPKDRTVVAVEPSPAMIAQRPTDLSPVVRAVAEALPFGGTTFGASMAVVTVHQWPDPLAGLAEMRRVTDGPVVILTFDREALDRLWLMEYAPELGAAEAARYPDVAAVAEVLGPDSEIVDVPIPLDCVDGFTEAFHGRPEAFLDPSVRGSQSAWTFLEPGVEQRVVASLADDLASGWWDERFGHLRTQPQFVGAVRLITGGARHR
jgi:SAM-dependent methyltransferase